MHPASTHERQPDISRHVAHHMTPRLRRVIRRAHELVEPPGAVGTEDLLVGVLDEPGNLGVVVLAVPRRRPAGSSVTRRQAPRVAARLGPGAGAEARPPNPGRRDGTSSSERAQLAEELLERLSFAARLVVASSIDVATELGHEFLGCEHLVAALCDDDEGAAGPILRGGHHLVGHRSGHPGRRGRRDARLQPERRSQRSEVDRTARRDHAPPGPVRRAVTRRRSLISQPVPVRGAGLEVAPVSRLRRSRGSESLEAQPGARRRRGIGSRSMPG